MIKINLAPIDELESPYWYLPELIMAIVVVAVSWFSINYYLDAVRDEITDVNSQTDAKQLAFQEITKDTAKYDQLDKDIKALNEKLDSLKNITVSKISRFKPVILLEHLQNLKPAGIWFNYVSDTTEKNRLTVVGKAFDSLLVAEFMTAMAATKIQELDPSDLRTQVYFNEVRLERISTTSGTSNSDRLDAEQNGADGDGAFTLEPEAISEQWTLGDKTFPELSKYPGFHLTLQYQERIPDANPAEILSN